MRNATYFLVATALLAASVTGQSLRQADPQGEITRFRDGEERHLQWSGEKKGRVRTLTLTITNQSFDQPFGPFFVMVHDHQIDPLYVRGQPASTQLATLAEDGDPSTLVSLYENAQGVQSVQAFANGVPFVGGSTFQIEVEVSRRYPLVTIASMAINTNDCFVALNGVRLRPGMVLDVPGLDSGSEENNELCASIPGPACASFPAGNVRSLNGEGFIHVHRGFFGIGDLTANRYDWRNPMMRVVVH